MEKTIKEIETEIDWIEQELFSPGSVEHSIWVSNAPKRDLITRWAENLEKLHEAGIYTEPINTISTHISNRLRKNNMQSAIHWVRHSLDAQYKNHAYDRTEDEFGGSDDRKDSSILLEHDVRENNRLYLIFLKRTIDELSKDYKRLSTDVIMEPEIPENEAEQFFLEWDHILMLHREAWDGREKVLSKLQYIMGYCLSNYSLNHAYVKYMKYVKQHLDRMLQFTPKQAGKLKRLQMRKVLPLFTPNTFEEALDLGFHGQQCGKCDSWRTERRYNPDAQKDQLFCFAEHEKDIPQWSELKMMKMSEVQLN